MTATRTRTAHPARRPSARDQVTRHRVPTRWRVVAGAAATSAALCALTLSTVVVVWRLQRPAPVVVCGTDALQAGALAGLAHFSAWLRREDASGFVGEVGWPAGADIDQWNALGAVWYRAADAIGLPVTAWAAGRWPPNYRMTVYRSGSTVGSAGPQAPIVEAHPGAERYLRGVALAGGSFGTGDGNPDFSNLNPGRYGSDYTYEDAGFYAYLAGRGVRLVRLAISWERLQDRPSGPLVAAELGRIRTAVGSAAAAGLRVVLDLHGYGDYALGSADTDGSADAGAGRVRRVPLGSLELPTTALADLWSRLARATADLPAIAGYGLLNEPTKLAAKGRDAALIWERASQQAVRAIRRTGDRRRVLVSGYAQMSPADWGRLHPHAWIEDPVRRVSYETHDYFDQDNSGRYRAGYSDELARAAPSTPLCQSLTPMTRRSLW
ncbi:glycoside hydrolase family 5 protein [Dactylosporangium cerinum]|uniref:Glycoside hydrolase family 5 protein n=1 Tax=Dactylosporangium cerinum TaxID=1434730 RepID=A0ABV9W471_9ACTN